MATFAIGDIHGNIRALDDLLARISREIGATDTVVVLGDYIDRGADSKACIERILDFRQTAKAKVVALLGNHEQWLLKTCRDHAQHSWILGMQGFTTIQSYSQVAAAKLDAELAALGPRIVLERVAVPYEIFFDTVPAEHSAFFSSLSPFWRTPEDHDGWPHPRIVGRTHGLDTIGEGVLTALQLPDAAIFQSRRFL